MKPTLNTPSVPVMPEADVPKVVPAPVAPEPPFTEQQRVASFWSIRLDKEDGHIEATHVSGRIFNGTVAAFNKLLRGE
jgi:hypothetical protein